MYKTSRVHHVTKAFAISSRPSWNIDMGQNTVKRASPLLAPTPYEGVVENTLSRILLVAIAHKHAAFDFHTSWTFFLLDTCFNPIPKPSSPVSLSQICLLNSIAVFETVRSYQLKKKQSAHFQVPVQRDQNTTESFFDKSGICPANRGGFPFVILAGHTKATCRWWMFWALCATAASAAPSTLGKCRPWKALTTLGNFENLKIIPILTVSGCPHTRNQVYLL